MIIAEERWIPHYFDNGWKQWSTSYNIEKQSFTPQNEVF